MIGSLLSVALTLAPPAPLAEGGLILARPAGFRAAPLEMPRAEAYLVTDTNGVMRLEDRYSELDLWTARALLGRWEDESGRRLLLFRLDAVVPKFDGAAVTRRDFYANLAHLDRREDERVRLQAIDALSPVPPMAGAQTRRARRRHLRDIAYHHGTNETAVVCSFLPEGSDHWYLASLELAADDDPRETFAFFDGEFLDSIVPSAAEEERPRRVKRAQWPGERELLRADARHSVTNYAAWHVCEAEEFTVIDDLPDGSLFVSALTNDFARMRRLYAETIPSPLDGSNTLCVARIHANRDEYLDAVGDDYAWTAAVWSPRHRELVAYLSSAGEEALLKTIRHEAFHQYLAYATSMIPTSPWFNEGYAEYFENEGDATFGLRVTPEQLDALAEMLGALVAMDYEAFYAGSGEEKRLKYALARSIAVFIEKGAPEVRFQPFRNLKRDYLRTLLKTQDMRAATAAAFGSADDFKLFVREWRRYWSYAERR